MARSFGANVANYLSRSTSIISNNDPRPISLSVWLKAGTTTQTNYSLFNNNQPGDGPGLYCAVRNVSGSTVKQSIYSNAYTDSSTFTLTTNWIHLGWTWTSTANACAFFLNGAANGTGTRAYSGAGAGGTDNGASIGTLNGADAGFFLDGALAEFTVWNAILTAAEWKALSLGVSSRYMRPLSIKSYVPIFGIQSPEPDYGAPSTWTINGTLLKANHAPVEMFTPKWRTPPDISALVSVLAGGAWGEAAWGRRAWGLPPLVAGGINSGSLPPWPLFNMKAR